jgi:hypothetical protein
LISSVRGDETSVKEGKCERKNLHMPKNKFRYVMVSGTQRHFLILSKSGIEHAEENLLEIA